MLNKYLIGLLLAFSITGFTGEKPGLFKEQLNGSLKDVQEIVYAVRGMGRDYHYYCNFGRLPPSQITTWWHEYGHRSIKGDPWRYGLGGGKLCRMNLRTGAINVIFEDKEGGVRDPQVHYDGKKILFSYRKGGEHRHHLCEINIDGTGFRQLTDGDYDDIEAIYLPNDDIMFVSTRADRIVPCNCVEVALVYRCDKDGKNMRLISTNTENETTPWMLSDGRVVLTRWEYQERGATTWHHLWTIHPDGTNMNAFFGNSAQSGLGAAAICDAKPISGTSKVIAASYGFHGLAEHMGEIITIDSSFGPDDKKARKVISNHIIPAPKGCYAKDRDKNRKSTASWRDPYPVGKDSIIVAAWKDLYVMDYNGNFEKFYSLPENTPPDLMVNEPRPLVSRIREPILTDRTDYSKSTGVMVLQRAFFGRNMGDIKAGDVKKLLIVEALSRPNSYINVGAITEGGGFFVTRIIGTVPVEEDGSANFEVPAGRSIYFVLLDKDNLSLKRMQSLTNVMPGETMSCIGCHEDRKTSPDRFASAKLLALKRPPSKPQLPNGVPEMFDFNRDIQPVFNKHCISCHNNEKFAGRLVLTGDVYSNRAQSLTMLNKRKYIIDKIERVQDNYTSNGNLPPRSIGSSASQLVRTVMKPHNDVKLTAEDVDKIRLWIDTGAVNVGTYAVIGSTAGNRYSLNKMEVFSKRCGSCHMNKKNKKEEPKIEFGPAFVELSKPEMSLLLRAPLAKSAGGLGLCSKSKDGSGAVFPDKSDPDYRKILEEINKSAVRYKPGSDWYGTDFKPNSDYIWHMKKYGVLPKNWVYDNKTDWYKLDLKYFDHLYSKYGF